MKGDYYRYLSEVASGDAKKCELIFLLVCNGDVEESRMSVKYGSKIETSNTVSFVYFCWCNKYFMKINCLGECFNFLQALQDDLL